MGYLTRCLTIGSVIFLTWIQNVLADTAGSGDPKGVMTDFSTQMVDILKGPITKILAALILMGGVAALLRGRHKIAVSCGLAFIILLFLPFLLEHVGG